MAATPRGKGAVARHGDLSPTTLFRGRAKNPDPTSEFVGQCRRGQTGAQTRRRDHVVTTTVTDTRKCVVLEQNENLGTRTTGHRLECRGDAVRRVLHHEPSIVKGPGQ